MGRKRRRLERKEEGLTLEISAKLPFGLEKERQERLQVRPRNRKSSRQEERRFATQKPQWFLLLARTEVGVGTFFDRQFVGLLAKDGPRAPPESREAPGLKTVKSCSPIG